MTKETRRRLRRILEQIHGELNVRACSGVPPNYDWFMTRMKRLDQALDLLLDDRH